MTFRDWPRELRKASYRGADFFVERDGVETGRRLVIHEFPNRDTPYIEDMGRDAYKISVTAYAVGDKSDSAARSLRSACESKGAAQLSLPLERFQAHCEKFQRDFSKDKLGYVAFSLTFVRDGGGAGPFPVAVMSHLVNLSIGGLLAPLRAAFGQQFSGLGVPSFVSAAAIDLIKDAAANIDVAVASPGVDTAQVPALALAAAVLHDDATALARVGVRATVLRQHSFVAETEASIEVPVVDRVFGLVGDIGAATVAEDAVDIMELLALFGLELDPLPQTTASERLAVANREALGGLVRISALAALASAAADMPLPDRRAAIALRARVAELFAGEREQAMAARDPALSIALDDLGGRLVEQISRRITDLSPVMTVSSDQMMPSLWWANRIYGNAARAAELAGRNRVIHPSFMPREFEALAR